jgi:hypothetical protein
MAETAVKIKPLTSATPLSKSRFVHGMQCPLYVWLEVRSDLAKPEVDAFTQALFDTGREVGEYARLRWDRRLVAAGQQPGVLIPDDPQQHGAAVADTTAALNSDAGAIHEAAFSYGGVKVKVDVLERLPDGTFAINEVKSSAHYEEKKHLLDAAVQLWVVRGAGVPVSTVRLVHLNNGYEWPGGEYDLEQLFTEEDVTEQAEALQEEVRVDVARLLRVLHDDAMPVVPDETSCSSPYGCPYAEGCPGLGEPVEHPISELPGRTDVVAKRCEAAGYRSLLELDDASARSLLRYANGNPHPVWHTTWRATVTDERIVLADCPQWIGALEYPIRHLDFETIASALPIVEHTRPFEVVPLQYSIHVERADGSIEHREFLAEANDGDPRSTLVERMLDDLGESGAIIHWSPYEKTVINALANNPRYSDYRERLLMLIPRLRDLGRAVSDWVFDRGFHGKWSLKKVYPTLVPGADPNSVHDSDVVIAYDELDGVAKGDEAAMVLLEYLRSETTPDRRTEIRRQLLQYCELDTWATVEVLRVLRGCVSS